MVDSEMRARCVIIGCAFALAAVGLAPQMAAAKGMTELRSTPPAGLRAGETWTAKLFVHAGAAQRRAAGPPSVLIHDDASGWTEIRATPIAGHPGAYTAAVVFPEPGTWTYHVYDAVAGGGSDFPPIVVADAGSPAPAWLLAVAALGAGGLAAAIAWRARPRSRLGIG
jgi:hypothetical protein